MQRSPRPRATTELSKSLHQQLNTYALVAGAAGVSALALTLRAEAKIVYTPAHVRLKIFAPPFPLDLNHDGIVDFYLVHSNTHGDGQRFLAACQFIWTYLGLFCYSFNDTNEVRVGVSMGKEFDAALPFGAAIQKGDRFPKRRNVMASFCCYSGSVESRWYGPWANGGKGVKNRYLGFKFKIKGRVHYGWARLTVTPAQYDFIATLTGYAYETIPGKGIVAGKTMGPDVTTVYPASLGHLAAGASAIPAWRAKQTTAKSQ
jgi:hypothetical protein